MAKGASFFKNVGSSLVGKAKNVGKNIASNLKVDGGVESIVKNVVKGDIDFAKKQMSDVIDSSVLDSKKHFDVLRDVNIARADAKLANATIIPPNDATGNINLANSTIKNGSAYRNIIEVPSSNRVIGGPRTKNIDNISGSYSPYSGQNVTRRRVKDTSPTGSYSPYSGSGRRRKKIDVYDVFLDEAGKDVMGTSSSYKHWSGEYDKYNSMKTAKDLFNRNLDNYDDTGNAFTNGLNKAKTAAGTAGQIGYEYFWNGANKQQRITRIGAAGVGYMGASVVGRALNGGTATRNNKGERDIAGIPFI